MDIARLHNLAISPTGFVFDPVTGNSFNTNETGVFIINHFRSGENPAQVAHSLADMYAVDVDTAEQDVLQLIEILRSHYLL